MLNERNFLADDLKDLLTQLQTSAAEAKGTKCLYFIFTMFNIAFVVI